MYAYSTVDQQLVNERVAQFRDQTQRFLKGEIADDEYRMLRLMNGIYIQRHAPMLRVAVPYGQMSSQQLRALAEVSRTYDKGYGHFTTRQNIQFNWPELARIPDILADLAQVQMHAIQTSGACIRSITSDPLAGVSTDEIADSRPWCEIIRQWSSLHPEFAYLPRKFKIAVTGAKADRAAVQVHDIGLRLVHNFQGDLGFEVLVGGGLGRTPMIGQVIREFLPTEHLLSYLEAILRIYNLHGRRDNKYKARIKILLKSMGLEDFTQQVEAEWQVIKHSDLQLPAEEIARVSQHFGKPAYLSLAQASCDKVVSVADQEYQRWLQHNVLTHQQPGYRIVMVPLKNPMSPPGDISHQQMDGLADLAEQFSFGNIRSTHDQNLVLAHVAEKDLYALWQGLTELSLARANHGTLTDMINCPGLDYCSLANAETLVLSRGINQAFDDLDYLYDLGPIELKISGCINACGHHHIGHIGILGVEKAGQQVYQFTLGGSDSEAARLGKTLGRSIPQDQVVATINTLLTTYLSLRHGIGESFSEVVNRLGLQPFKEAVYGSAKQSAA
ncbi:MAG: nitrite/sulfite reductase [Gammaproteobacteria bacterium]|nr:nitrite/sulfite reductase [Gammaproteobacteria bacterium]